VAHQAQRSQEAAADEEREGDQAQDERAHRDGVPAVACHGQREFEHQAGRAAGDCGEGARKALDNEGEAERADGEIDSRQAHEHLGDETRDGDGDQDAEEDGEEDRNAGFLVQHPRGVSWQHGEGRLAEGEHAGDAENEVEAYER
jgi:hypothetical protein